MRVDSVSKINLCILASAHPPGDGRVTYKLATSFIEEGVNVSWIGFGDSVPRETGVNFHLLGRASRSLTNRFFHSNLLVQKGRCLPPQDFWLAVEPDSARAAIQLSEEMGGKAIFDIHEVYHKDMIQGRVPKLLLPIASGVLKWKLQKIAAHCELVIAPGYTRIEPYIKPNHPYFIVRHCQPLSQAKNWSATNYKGQPQTLRILHGKATKSHGTISVLKAISYAKSQQDFDCKLLCFKSFSPRENFGYENVMEEAKKLGLAENIEWLEPVPFTQMTEIMKGCHLGVIAYPRYIGINCAPNRFFEYLAMGMPSINPIYAKEIAPLVEETHSGLLADVENPEDFGNKLLRFAFDPKLGMTMGLNAKKAFCERYNMETEIQPFISWIKGNVFTVK
jgi:glycosyltransferase involved in cell wall biosynthesis